MTYKISLRKRSTETLCAEYEEKRIAIIKLKSIKDRKHKKNSTQCVPFLAKYSPHKNWYLMRISPKKLVQTRNTKLNQKYAEGFLL